MKDEKTQFQAALRAHFPEKAEKLILEDNKSSGCHPCHVLVRRSRIRLYVTCLLVIRLCIWQLLCDPTVLHLLDETVWRSSFMFSPTVGENIPLPIYLTPPSRWGTPTYPHPYLAYPALPNPNPTPHTHRLWATSSKPALLHFTPCPILPHRVGRLGPRSWGPGYNRLCYILNDICYTTIYDILYIIFNN